MSIARMDAAYQFLITAKAKKNVMYIFMSCVQMPIKMMYNERVAFLVRDLLKMKCAPGQSSDHPRETHCVALSRLEQRVKQITSSVRIRG